jgi:hypothetical protein
MSDGESRRLIFPRKAPAVPGQLQRSGQLYALQQVQVGVAQK